MKTNFITFLILTASFFFFTEESQACVNPDTIVTVTVNYDTVTNAPFITSVEIRLSNLRLMNENKNKICSCALSQWSTLFSNIDYVAFVEGGTNTPYAGFAKWNATAASSNAWNNSKPGYNWGGFVADVINSGLSAVDTVDLVIRASAPAGVTYTLLGDSTLGYNSLKGEVESGALGTDEWSATNNDLVASHQSVVGFNPFVPGNQMSFSIKDPAYFTTLDNDILNNIPIGLEENIEKSESSIFSYPNPASDVINVDLNISEKTLVYVLLYNITGEKIAVIEDAEYEVGQYTIHYQMEDDLNNGMYFIEYNIGSKRSVSKILKQ